ncbi:MAG: hypothetical protein ABIB97_04305 [Patescibacteria group bacterium]
MNKDGLNKEWIFMNIDPNEARDISRATQKLIHSYQDWQKLRQPKTGVSTIHVDEVASTVARFYEKIRMVVDWKEEHLIRRIAIERILKRRLLVNDNQYVAEPFVKELIRGGHFPNDSIPKSKIKTVQKIIDKYTYIIKNSPPPPADKNRSQFFSQMVESAGCEVESTLDPASYLKADALIEYMEKIIKKRIRIGNMAQSKTNISQETIDIQIYIAVQQALLKLDSPIITYNLFRRYFNDWSYLSQERLGQITKNIHNILGNIEQHFNYVLADKIYKTCKQYNTPFLLLGDIVEDDPAEIDEKIAYPVLLEKLYKGVYNIRFKSLKKRVRRAAVYSTLSIFMTNALSLYLLEIPLALYVIGNFNKIAMVVDIMGPTLLMALLVVTIRLPKKDNFRLVMEEAYKNIYLEESEDIYEIELYPKKSFAFTIVSGLLYLVSFVAVFGLIIWVFWSVNFPPFSYIINIVFTSLIAFAGTIIRQRARELHVTEERGRFFHIIIEPISIPIIRVGKWLASRWKRINIVAVFFSLLIDTPFLLFAEFLEQWRYFLKEKREDIR